MNQLKPKPVAQSLPDQVAALIVQQIANGKLAAGHSLPSQRQLARSFGVGLAVVREAVKRLEALAILSVKHGSGTVVLPFRWLPQLYDPSLFLLAVKRIGIRDLWETRRILEVQIARLTAERVTAKNLKEIRAVLDRASPLPRAYSDSQVLNREFHVALAKGSQNAVLVDLLAPLVDVHVEGIAHDFTLDICRRTWAAHETIYDAVARRDVSAAEQAMRDHFTIGPIAVDAGTANVPTRRNPRKKPGRTNPSRLRPGRSRSLD